MKKTEMRPFFKDKGVCRFCNVPALNGHCAEHSMFCPTCKGFGATNKKIWEKLYGRWSNDNFLREALIALQVQNSDYKIEIWFDGSHYDHGDEPAIKIYYKGEVIYSEWGIFLPDEIKKAANFIKSWKMKKKKKNRL